MLVLEGSEPRVSPEEVRQAFEQSFSLEGMVQRLGTAPPEDVDMDGKEIQDLEGQEETRDPYTDWKKIKPWEK